MSTATVDYQSGSNSVEIMIAMSADHFEAVLRKNSGREVELDRTVDAGKLAQEYVFSRFELRDASGKTLQLKWVGWEIKGGNVNCYVEAKAACDSGLKLRNDLLIDWQRDQINRVLPKRDGKSKPPQLMFWVDSLGAYCQRQIEMGSSALLVQGAHDELRLAEFVRTGEGSTRARR